MSVIASLIQALTPADAAHPTYPTFNAAEEAYLAQATNAQDLEFRLRELEDRSHEAQHQLPLGLGLR